MLKLTEITEDRFGIQYKYTFRDTVTDQEYTAEYADITKLRDTQIINAKYINSRFPYLQYSGDVKKKITKIISLYHGSDHTLKMPYKNDKNARPHNDYGRGFYTTQFPAMADEWALLQTSGTAKTPVRNDYLLDMSGLTVLDMDKRGILTWIAEVLSHRKPDGIQDDIITEYCRKYKVNSSGYDIIAGYRADNFCFSMITAFADNIISAEEITMLFSKVNSDRQICLKSAKAFDQLEFVGSSAVSEENPDRAVNNEKNTGKQILEYISERRYAVRICGEKPAGITFADALSMKQRNKNYV